MTRIRRLLRPARLLRPGPARGRRRRAVLAAAAAGALLAGCSTSVGTLSVPDPPSTTLAPPAAADSLPPGLASVPEAPVPGATTTTTVAIGPGAASLDGTVLGPVGAVRGATVEIDRFVGDTFASAVTTTRADGSWSFTGILGGRYRVRAWEAPNLDMATPQVVFLSSGQSQTVALQLTAYSGPQVGVAINPAGPVEGQPANLVVQVTNPTVSANGVLINQPVAGTPVSLVDGPGWQVDNGNPITTDASGTALFTVTCTAPGTDPLSAQVGNGSALTLQMPPCGQAPIPTTTVPFTGAGSTTTSTCPTTTTTAAPDPTVSTSTTFLSFGGC